MEYDRNSTSNLEPKPNSGQQCLCVHLQQQQLCLYVDQPTFRTLITLYKINSWHSAEIYLLQTRKQTIYWVSIDPKVI